MRDKTGRLWAPMMSIAQIGSRELDHGRRREETLQSIELSAMEKLIVTNVGRENRLSDRWRRNLDQFLEVVANLKPEFLFALE